MVASLELPQYLLNELDAKHGTNAVNVRLYYVGFWKQLAIPEQKAEWATRASIPAPLVA